MMKKFAVVALVASFGLAACQTQDPYTGEQKTSKATYGALGGAVIGALGGALIGGGDSTDRRQRAMIGAGIGALAGGGVGYYMDKQEAELTQRLRASGVSVTRVGNDIILNMPGNVTFATNSSDINAKFYDVLNSVAIVLKEYDKTLIDVTGHTDSTGSDQYNLELSQKRAQSVAAYLIGQSVDSRRFYIVGAGESQPIATNDTPQGREQNRRVEIRLSPLTTS
ncbi:OmpA family protein [Parvibaculum sp.]|uniref:OmpA family protein n=1 Tax=Parvibaculum sp. TaxID=2024848 RepID=UPI002730976C|nr:OmpA family protein [Parvibaculum sp.]MDP1626355.1 OmpA family protein [Parvibaculum sp.]MDP2151254.1 OmpA family protein [Parvibaculum sp.]MDP3327095.1 OmpA family protein [Parvibaculum sp.]